MSSSYLTIIKNLFLSDAKHWAEGGPADTTRTRLFRITPDHLLIPLQNSMLEELIR